MAVKGKRRGRQISPDVLDAKITKAQERVVTTKKAYDAAVKELKDLMEKRDTFRREDLYKRLLQSRWTYEQIINMISSEPPEE
jgi:hypothetical protein